MQLTRAALATLVVPSTLIGSVGGRRPGVGKKTSGKPIYAVQSIDFRGRLLQDFNISNGIPSLTNSTENSTFVEEEEEEPVVISTEPETETEEVNTTTSLDGQLPESGSVIDVLIYGCSPSGLYTALRLLEPGRTQDYVREEVYVTADGEEVVVEVNGTNTSSRPPTVAIVESSSYCSGRLITASPPDMPDFHAELGDLGYHSTPTSYVDVLVNYLGLEVKELVEEIEEKNLLYLRGNYIRGAEEAEKAKEHYHLTYIEQDQTSEKLLADAVDMIIPNVLEMNETMLNKFWVDLYQEGHEFKGRQLYEQGFWNVLSQVMTAEAFAFVKDACGQDSLFNNKNALEGVMAMVLSMKAETKVPIDGMEMFMTEMLQRVTDLGGVVVTDTVMDELLPGGLGNGTDSETLGENTTEPLEGTHTVNLVRNGEVTSLNVGRVVIAGDLSKANEEILKTSEFFDDMLVSHMDELQEISYTRLYLCYKYPWWTNQGITAGRSVTNTPLRNILYLDSGCLVSHVEGHNVEFWKGLQNWTKVEEGPVDIKSLPTDEIWTTLRAPDMMVEEAQNQLKILHDLQYIPDPVDTLFITSEDVGSSLHQFIVGANPVENAVMFQRPKEDWNVFMIGEKVSFPYLGLEADIQSAEQLLQTYFFGQPEIGTFDNIGVITIDGDTQLGVTVSTSADGNRIATISVRPDGGGEVSVYQRIGDDDLGIWASLGNTFVSANIPVALMTGNATTPVVVESRVQVDVPRATLSGDGLTLAVRISDARRVNYIQVFKDQDGQGNWTKLDQDLALEDFDAQFGHSIDLSYDGTILAVGAPGFSNQEGRVFVYNCATGECVQMGMSMGGLEEQVARYGESVSLSYDGKVVAAGAPTDESNAGFASIFTYETEWLQVGELLTIGDEDDMFGHSVSLAATGDAIAVGAPNLGSGAAHVFRYDLAQTIWTPSGTVAGVEEGDTAGFSVSLSGDGSRLFVGAPQISNNETGSGYVLAFEATEEGEWVPYGSDVAGVEAGDQLGISVATNFEGTFFVVGAPAPNSGRSGSVYTFSYVEAEMGFEGIARDVWEGSANGTYAWDEADMCVGMSGLGEDNVTGFVQSIVGSLEDLRVDSMVNEAFLFNSQDNSPMGNCTTLLDTAYFVLETYAEDVDFEVRGQLSQAIDEFESRIGDSAPIPTSAPLVETNETETITPAPAPIVEGNETEVIGGNETEVIGGNETLVIDEEEEEIDSNSTEVEFPPDDDSNSTSIEEFESTEIDDGNETVVESIVDEIIDDNSTDAAFNASRRLRGWW